MEEKNATATKHKANGIKLVLGLKFVRTYTQKIQLTKAIIKQYL